MASSWSTPNTKTAAALNALGFPLDIRITERVRGENLTGEVTLQLMLNEPNALRPGLKMLPLVKGLESGALAEENPLHPLHVGVLACNAYDIITTRQLRGQAVRLVPVHGGRLYVHGPGQENAALALAGEVIQTDDLRLACALSLVGFPVIKVEGSAPRRLFTLPRYGHRLLVDGLWTQPDAAAWVKRQAESRNRALALEAVKPLHPLVAGYTAGRIHGQIMARVNSKKRVLLASPKVDTGKHSIISETATPRVLEAMAAHLRITDNDR